MKNNYEADIVELKTNITDLDFKQSSYEKMD